MTLDISFKKEPDTESHTAIGMVFEDKQLGDALKKLDQDINGFIAHAVENSENFKGKPGQVKMLSLPKDAAYQQILLVGMGKLDELDAHKVETAGGKACPSIKGMAAAHVTVLSEGKWTAQFVHGVQLRAYHFEKYKSKNEDEPKITLEKIDVVGDDHDEAEKAFEVMNHISQGIFLARDLVNEPPNHLYPEAYVQIIKDELKPLGVEIEVLDEKKLQKMNAGAILAVGMGSMYPPRIVIMRWNGSGKDGDKPLALVGKGVTFDTGGISIKPGAGMDEMKMDMGGSAAVVGTMKALALRKSKANVVGIVGLAENAVSERSYRPGDIITSYSGKTIEVLNTDAEGRLVLGDCLTYVQEKYQPEAIIDLATLTGAMMVALGHEYCGTFVTHDEFWTQLEHASAQTGEKLWRMPLDEAWKKDMESNVADIQNMAKSGRYAGACTAAGFLQHFIESEDTHWAHMDIAGTAWSKKDKPTVPKYGSGFGVRVLNQLIADYYE